MRSSLLLLCCGWCCWSRSWDCEDAVAASRAACAPLRELALGLGWRREKAGREGEAKLSLGREEESKRYWGAMFGLLMLWLVLLPTPRPGVLEREREWGLETRWFGSLLLAL